MHLRFPDSRGRKILLGSLFCSLGVIFLIHGFPLLLALPSGCPALFWQISLFIRNDWYLQLNSFFSLLLVYRKLKTQKPLWSLNYLYPFWTLWCNHQYKFLENVVGFLWIALGDLLLAPKDTSITFLRRRVYTLGISGCRGTTPLRFSEALSC